MDDRTTFRELYGQHYGRVCAILTQRLGDSHLAEDAAQDAFLKLYDALPRLEQRDDDFLPWLQQVAVNHGRDELRRRRFRRSTDPGTLAALQDAAGEVEHPPDVREQLPAAMLLSLGRLSPLQRRVVFLRFVAKLNCAEVAIALGASEGTVRQSQYKALQSLQAQLAPSGVEAVSPLRQAVLPFRRLERIPGAAWTRFSIPAHWLGRPAA